MLKTFNWHMDMRVSAQVKYRKGKNQYGDGYAQHFKLGINNKSQSWSGTKTGDLETVIKPIMAFIDEHEGVKPFLWTDPHGVTATYTCEGHSVSQTVGNHWQISLTFERYHSI